MPRGMKRSITSIARDLANTVTRGGRKVIPTRWPGEDGGPSRGRRGAVLPRRAGDALL